MSRKGAEVTSTPARLTLLRVGCFRASHCTLHLSLPHFGSLSETILLQDEAETTGGGNQKAEEEKAKLNQQVEKEVELRMQKEKGRGSKFNPDISLEKMG